MHDTIFTNFGRYRTFRSNLYKHHAQKDVQLVTPYLYTVREIDLLLKFWIINSQRSSS